MATTKWHQRKLGGISIGRLGISLAALGGISVSTFAVSTGAAVSNRTPKPVIVSAAKNAKLGTILVSGKTLYTLNKNDCTGKCLKFWPALTLPKGVTKAAAGTGVSAAKLGTLKIASGARQVTYSGKALYFFVEDTATGQVHGNKVSDGWGTWSAVVTAKPALSPTSAVVTTRPTATSTPTSGTSPTATSSPTSTTPTTPTTTPTTTTAPKPVTTTTTVPSGGGVAF